MSRAIDDLVEIKRKHPSIILRMIALTDGYDTGHDEGNSP